MAAIPSLILTGISGYGLYVSYNNIIRLQTYEERSEKAAEWSTKAAERLHKTRTTQTSGTITLVVSCISGLVLLSTALPQYVLAAIAFMNGAVLFASRTHMANFWNDKVQVQVPFVETFNKAVRGSKFVVEILKLLSLAWFEAGIAWTLGLAPMWSNLGFITSVGMLSVVILGSS